MRPTQPNSALNRRQFLATGASTLLLPTALRPQDPLAPQTVVAELWATLTPLQRQTCAFSFHHPLRLRVDNNWQITPAKVASFQPHQQALIREIFLRLHDPEYAEAVLRQVEHDNGGDGLSKCAIALFGQPGTGRFEFVLTGRHVTRRCDGDSVHGAAFGGPIFYGHAAEDFFEAKDHAGNLYWFQARRANDVFAALDGQQRQRALCVNPRAEQGTRTVKLRRDPGDLPGIPVADLSADQQGLLRTVLTDLLAPFRRADAEEVLRLVEAAGFDQLRMAFYRDHDIGEDQVWDVWQIEGPSALWFFRGAPHVHVWVHVRDQLAHHG